MNFVFVSPHFPDTYYRFCKGLRNNGVRVLGIVEGFNFPHELYDAVDDLYRVDDLKNMDQKVNAIRYFISRYGSIDFIESNNEFWLNDDAKLRTIFDVNTGPKENEIPYFRHKSLMKELYQLANVKTAKWELLDNYEQALAFANSVGYPIIIKPDNGVGAINTLKVSNDQELKDAVIRLNDTKYIMEQYIEGELLSLDGVVDSKGDIVIPTHHVFPTPIMEVVNGLTDVMYYTSKVIPKNLIDAGQRVLKAFKAKSRFFHLEFFKLTKDIKGLGKKGELIGLEVNMRVPGGYTPDMINFAYSLDIYQIWADVIAYDKQVHEYKYPTYYCCYTGRRDNVRYEYDYDELITKYKNNIKWQGRMPDALSQAMGNYFVMANFKNLKDLNEFTRLMLTRHK